MFFLRQTLLRLLSACATFAALVFAAGSTCAAAASEPTSAYLLVHFTGESARGEQIYFSVSEDGLHWTDLNNGEPVLISTLGDKGVRDPSIIRSPDGKKFYLLATDLRIANRKGWGAARFHGSTSLVIWGSTDLAHWSEPRLVAVAPEDAGCAWAPEAVYDEEKGDYLVFWASTTRRDNFAKHCIWAARTRDFKTFGAPFIYIEKPNTIIDTTIVHDQRSYYRFTKNEKFKTITLETSPKLMGPWTQVPDFSLAKLVGYEGPECYIVEPASPGKPATWCLILDQFSKGTGYQPFVTHDLARGQFTPGECFTFPFPFRHGSVIPVTSAEYQRLQTAYANTAPAK